jgi:hypothetical protein
MRLKKLAAKVADYRERLEEGKASRIEPRHVEKVLKKLRKRKVELEERVATESDGEHKDRLHRKLEIAREQISRAEWLLAEIG